MTIPADITSNANAVAADLAAVGMRAGAASVGLVRTYGMLLQAAVKKNASLPRTGPPGPRIQTGAYNRSIALNVSFSVGGPVASVGTNAVQGRRLELGFYGMTDSLGRTFYQEPMPHFGPALDTIAPLFVTAIAKLADPS